MCSSFLTNLEQVKPMNLVAKWKKREKTTKDLAFNLLGV